jgi:formylglycine-generating enzyme required for sulfatase activity
MLNRLAKFQRQENTLPIITFVRLLAQTASESAESQVYQLSPLLDEWFRRAYKHQGCDGEKSIQQADEAMKYLGQSPDSPDLPGTIAIIPLSANITMRLRWIKPGRFWMGSPEDEKGRYSNEGPRHGVEITQGFWLGESPCTQAQWEAVMGNNPSHFTGKEKWNHPVEQVSWDDCHKFCRKLGGMYPELYPRLPTEAQWEYACRAGSQSAFNNGSSCTEPEGEDPALAALGWFDKNSGGETHSVKEKPANRWGLYDMHGNVWEWCADWYDAYQVAEQRDPTGPVTGRGRVIRGGGWNALAWYCRSAFRLCWHPLVRRNFLGFRLAAVQPG